MSETKKQVMEIRPCKKMAVIRRTELSNNSSLSAVNSTPPQIGEVVIFGEGKKPVEFKVGTIVAYRQYGEYEFFINGETLYFVKFADILGIIRKKPGCCKD